MTDKTRQDSGSTHIIRYALELGLLWIDGDGRDKVREALDELDTLEAQLEAIGAGGVSGPLIGRASLAASAGSEPVAWRISCPNEPDLGFWLAEEDGGEGFLSEPLYTRTAPPAAGQDARPCHVFTVRKAGALTEWEPTSMAFALPDGAHALYTLPQPTPPAQAADSVLEYTVLLKEARGALWQPANVALCERIDAYLDAARKQGADHDKT